MMLNISPRDYVIIKHKRTGKLLRFSFLRNKKIPDDFELISNTNKWYYDKDSKLKPQFWAKQRCNEYINFGGSKDVQP